MDRLKSDNAPIENSVALLPKFNNRTRKEESSQRKFHLLPKAEANFREVAIYATLPARLLCWQQRRKWNGFS
jgi:hypothetical protein